MQTRFRHHVPRIRAREALNAGFDQDPWAMIPASTLSYFMGTPPSHRPLTRFKIAWDGPWLCVMFTVRDRYVRAVAQNYQDPVCEDSCVEFFFTPNPDISTGYFNIEINCGGTGLFEFHPANGKPMIPMPKKAFDRIAIRSSLPRIIEPEITGELDWTVEYRFPVDILSPYCPVTMPEKGALWRGNIYKCADKSSHPHWLTWAPVDFPRPRFHLPDYFGWLVFE